MDEWGNYVGDYGENQKTPSRRKEKATSSYAGILRILSMVFAAGFLIFAFGMSGHIYYNRQAMSYAEEDFQSERESISYMALEGDLKGTELQQEKDKLQKKIDLQAKFYRKMMAPLLRSDIVGTYRASIMDANDYDLSEYSANEKQRILEKIEENKQETENEIKNLTADMIQKYKAELEKNKKDATEKVGFRFVWLTISAYSTIFMSAGGALALIALIAWFVLGGLSGPVSQTTVLPVVIACVAAGIILMVVFGLLLSTMRGEDIKLIGPSYSDVF